MKNFEPSLFLQFYDKFNSVSFGSAEASLPITTTCYTDAIVDENVAVFDCPILTVPFLTADNGSCTWI